MNRLWLKLVAAWPLCWKSTAELRAKASQASADFRLASERKRHAEELKQTIEAVERIKQHVGEIAWDRDRERYAMTLMFDPRAFGGGQYPMDREIIAEIFARDVHRQIATAVFVQAANETRRERCVGNRAAYWTGN